MCGCSKWVFSEVYKHERWMSNFCLNRNVHVFVLVILQYTSCNVNFKYETARKNSLKQAQPVQIEYLPKRKIIMEQSDLLTKTVLIHMPHPI